MALEDDVKQALIDAGKAIKPDLWHAGDDAFLVARAKDLVGLHQKAAATTDPLKKRAYGAAASDVLNHVKLFALIRVETAVQSILDVLGQFFLSKVVPRLIQLLPALIGLL